MYLLKTVSTHHLLGIRDKSVLDSSLSLSINQEMNTYVLLQPSTKAHSYNPSTNAIFFSTGSINNLIRPYLPSPNSPRVSKRSKDSFSVLPPIVNSLVRCTQPGSYLNIVQGPKLAIPL